MISISSRLLRRSLTCRPVVPASPSINTFFDISNEVDLWNALGEGKEVNAEALDTNKVRIMFLLQIIVVDIKSIRYQINKIVVVSDGGGDELCTTGRTSSNYKLGCCCVASSSD